MRFVSPEAPKAIVRPSGETSTFIQLPSLGRPDCAAIRMNPATFGVLPASACTLTSPSNYGPDRVTHYIYDAAGQLLQVQKAYGITTDAGFPATLQQNYAGYEYTLNGRQKAVVDANGNRAEMTSDAYDRQQRWIFPAPVGAKVANQADYEEYGYDDAGNRTSLVSSRISRVAMPGGALTSHLSGVAWRLAAGADAAAGGNGPVTLCSGLMTWFSGACVSCTGLSGGGDCLVGTGACAQPEPATSAAAIAAVTRYFMQSSELNCARP